MHPRVAINRRLQPRERYPLRIPADCMAGLLRTTMPVNGAVPELRTPMVFSQPVQIGAIWENNYA